MPKLSIHETYLKTALIVAERSYAVRKQVGAVIANDYDILSYGWNGMPAGYPNQCEIEDGSTDPLVYHGEANAILKCARTGKQTEGSNLYLTLSPCVPCALMIMRAGIKEVHYIEKYRITDGLDLLEENGIQCIQHKISSYNKKNK